VTESDEVSKQRVRNAIEAAIEDSEDAWEKFVSNNRSQFEDDEHQRPLAMKYMASEYAEKYKPASNHRFYMGEKDYTWGRAVYVTGVVQPLSTLIYGRVGLVSWFNPDAPEDNSWRVFDARDPTKAALYLDWLKLQDNYEKAMLTVHTNHWLHGLRNDFREEFGIDVVMCAPDEHDDGFNYTHLNDIWLCVSDWDPKSPKLPQKRKLKQGFSDRFPDVRITVIPEEEFFIPPDDPKKPPVRPPAEPTPRVPRLALSGNPPVTPTNVGQTYWQNVRQAYWQGRIITVPS
jgi:hypothetical protein